MTSLRKEEADEFLLADIKNIENLLDADPLYMHD